MIFKAYFLSENQDTQLNDSGRHSHNTTLWIPQQSLTAHYQPKRLSVTVSPLFLFPRAVGIGVSSVASRVGGILSPIILLLGDSIASLPLILFGSSAVLAGLLALFLPETKGQKLPQTLEEGEEMGK